ncbi:MAG TPA: helix-turn-helix domain-containing protein [Gemmatimonadaceae bacterium]|nr:helix-turn-helix domain-containing protein [Gemmatimonadaceae bacterium]
MSEEIRHRILEAAARVYAQYGFRGATTRLIATEAGVNEVTLFRTFGSKARLLQEMLQQQVSATEVPTLPTDVADPARAITAWCATTLQYLRGHAHLIRKTIAEAEERPEAACQACEGPNSAGASLVLYVERLREEGLADGDADVDVAVSMFMSAMFGDALYREVMPQAFPQPAEDAPARYVHTFLRAVGFRASSLPVRSRPARVAGSRRRSR